MAKPFFMMSEEECLLLTDALEDIVLLGPPSGRKDWTQRLLADELVRQGHVLSISYGSIGKLLRSRDLCTNQYMARPSMHDVVLTPSKRAKLKRLVRNNLASEYEHIFAQVLLDMDRNGPAKSLGTVAVEVGVSERRIKQIRAAYFYGEFSYLFWSKRKPRRAKRPESGEPASTAVT